MLTGHFDKNAGRPLIQGYVDIPSQNVCGFVLFLIDTGSDCTVLMPGDARRLNVDYSKIKDSDHSIGSAGASLDFICPAAAIFAEIGVTAYTYNVRLRLPEPKPELFIVPSLIGWDILSRWRLSFDPGKRTIIADVMSADARHSLDDKKGP